MQLAKIAYQYSPDITPQKSHEHRLHGQQNERHPFSDLVTIFCFCLFVFWFGWLSWLRMRSLWIFFMQGYFVLNYWYGQVMVSVWVASSLCCCVRSLALLYGWRQSRDNNPFCLSFLGLFISCLFSSRSRSSSMLLYVHRDCTDYYGRGTKDVHLHFHTVLSSDSLSVQVQCCFTSTETVRTITDGEPRTSTSTSHSS